MYRCKRFIPADDTDPRSRAQWVIFQAKDGHDLPDDVALTATEIELLDAQDRKWNFTETGAIEEIIDAPSDPVLTRAQFEWLLATTGLGDVWDTIESAVKTTDADIYALLKKLRHRERFYLDEVMRFVLQLQPTIDAIAPGSDVSRKRIKLAWDLAAAE